MSIAINWILSKQCLQITATGLLTFDDLVQSTKTTHNMLQENESRVHILFDMQYALGFPTDFHYIVQESQLLDDDNLGWFIIIANEQVVRFVENSANKSAVSIKAFTQMEDALDFLAHCDKLLFQQQQSAQVFSS